MKSRIPGRDIPPSFCPDKTASTFHYPHTSDKVELKINNSQQMLTLVCGERKLLQLA